MYPESNTVYTTVLCIFNTCKDSNNDSLKKKKKTLWIWKVRFALSSAKESLCVPKLNDRPLFLLDDTSSTG